jgi:hypothetical protein
MEERDAHGASFSLPSLSRCLKPAPSLSARPLFESCKNLIDAIPRAAILRVQLGFRRIRYRNPTYVAICTLRHIRVDPRNALKT